MLYVVQDANEDRLARPDGAHAVLPPGTLLALCKANKIKLKKDSDGPLEFVAEGLTDEQREILYVAAGWSKVAVSTPYILRTDPNTGGQAIGMYGTPLRPVALGEVERFCEENQIPLVVGGGEYCRILVTYWKASVRNLILDTWGEQAMNERSAA